MNGEDAAPVTLVDLIDKLAEPDAPASVPMTPETAGWVVLAAALVLALVWLAWRGIRRWRANAYRRAALAELAGAGDDPAAIAPILRRTALAAWPRDEIADLAGGDWLAFLDRTGGRSGFTDGPGAALATAPFRPEATPSAPGLGDLAARWVRDHRVTATGARP